MKLAVGISLFFALLVLLVTGHDGKFTLHPKLPEVLPRTYNALAFRLRTFEYRAFDQKFAARGTRKPPYYTAIAAIDEKSIAEIGRWPWPRTTMARLIEKLDALGAKSIALDVVFSEPDQLGTYGLVGQILDRLDRVPKLNPNLEGVKNELISIQGQWDLLRASLPDPDTKARVSKLLRLQAEAVDRLLEELSRQRERESALSDFEGYLREERERVNADRILGEIVQRTPSVILGYFFLKNHEVQGLRSEQAHDFSTLASSKLGAVLGAEDPGRAIASLESSLYRGVRANIAAIAGTKTAQGFFNAEADDDGIYRKAPLVVAMDGAMYPSLNVQAVQVYQRSQEAGEDTAETLVIPVFSSDETGLRNLQMSTPHTVLCNPDGTVYFNWYGPGGTFPTYGIVDILEDRVPREALQNKIVFVGPTALAIADLRTTAFGYDFPGVEMHATLASNILGNDYLTRGPGIFVCEILLVLLGGILLGFALRGRRPWVGFTVTGVLLVTLSLVDYFVFFSVFHVWVRSFWPLVGIFSVYLGVTLFQFFTEESARRQLRQTFNAYVSPSVIDQMLGSPDRFRLGGERKNLTVFFSDIRGFTSISELFTPEDLVNFLNDYLTPMSDIVLRYDGTLDKYIGDAIMGFWGAPLDQADHAERACRAALDMVEKLEELRAGWVERNLPAIEVGLGVNTGAMAVGNMGSLSRFSYTVMGDAVNLASRLEGLCKEYGCRIILGSQTAKEVHGKFILRLLDRVRVKGKAVGEEIYELMAPAALSPTGISAEQQAVFQEIARIHQEGLNHYWKKSWDSAEVCFQKVLTLRSTDKSASLFLKQIATFRTNPPPADWDGIRTMTTK